MGTTIKPSNFTPGQQDPDPASSGSPAPIVTPEALAAVASVSQSIASAIHSLSPHPDSRSLVDSLVAELLNVSRNLCWLTRENRQLYSGSLFEAPDEEDLAEEIRFIRDSLAGGPLAARAVMSAARKAGFDRQRMRYARVAAGATVERSGGNYVWVLPVPVANGKG